MVDGVEWIAKRSFYLFQLFNKNICEHQNSQRASHSTATTFIFSLRVSPKNTHKNRLKMKKKTAEKYNIQSRAKKKTFFIEVFIIRHQPDKSHGVDETHDSGPFIALRHPRRSQ